MPDADSKRWTFSTENGKQNHPELSALRQAEVKLQTFSKLLCFSNFQKSLNFPFSSNFKECQRFLSFPEHFCEIPAKFHQNFAEKSQNSLKNAKKIHEIFKFREIFIKMRTKMTKFKKIGKIPTFCDFFFYEKNLQILNMERCEDM